MAHGVAVGLLVVEQAGGVQVPEYDLTAAYAVHALVRAGLAAHGAVQVDGGDEWQAVTLPHLEVDGVVARRDLERARAKLRVDGVVAHDGQRPVENGQQDATAYEVAVAVIVRVYCHGGVAKEGLRAGGRDRQVAFAILQRIANVVKE